MILHQRSYARAGLLGNPSDGYYGKTLSFTFENFHADVTLWESPSLQFLPTGEDDATFENLDAMMKELSLFGYYGGIRLLKATTRVFVHYCHEHGLALPSRNFSVSYQSNIPRLVGLAGSSAIVTAMFKALLEFYEVEIPRPIIPTLCLNAEVQELNLQAGLQDRVVQIYDGLMFMDFNRQLVTTRGYGEYHRVDPRLLPRLYIAYDPLRAEVSGRYHQQLRVLFDQQDAKVVGAMTEFADIAQRGYEALLAGRSDELPKLMNANFDLRDRIFNVSVANRRMVMTARSTGASAKFPGSGGAIVGTYEDEAMLTALEEKLEAIGCQVILPRVIQVLHD